MYARVLDFTADVFLSEKELFSWTYISKKTRGMTKIFPVWNKILKVWDILFEIMQIERPTMQQNLSQKFLWQGAGTSGNNTEKELQKPHPKLQKIYILNIYR